MLLIGDKYRRRSCFDERPAEGVQSVDSTRGFNVGIAEANMMGIGEGFAVLGNNVWVSTFCPFFELRVLRRIAIGYQERMEAIGPKMAG